MRKITKEAVTAFYNRGAFNNQNTSVATGKYGTELKLDGDIIATLCEDGLRITLAGWNTPTTRERLNGLQGVKVTTKQGQVYLNGSKWDGEWIVIV